MAKTIKHPGAAHEQSNAPGTVGVGTVDEQKATTVGGLMADTESQAVVAATPELKAEAEQKRADLLHHGAL